MCVCVCVRERETGGLQVYVGVYIPFGARNRLHLPACLICFPSPYSLTVNPVAGQFGNSIKASGFYDYDYDYDDD